MIQMSMKKEILLIDHYLLVMPVCMGSPMR